MTATTMGGRLGPPWRRIVWAPGTSVAGFTPLGPSTWASTGGTIRPTDVGSDVNPSALLMNSGTATIRSPLVAFEAELLVGQFSSSWTYAGIALLNSAATVDGGAFCDLNGFGIVLNASSINLDEAFWTVGCNHPGTVSLGDGSANQWIKLRLDASFGHVRVSIDDAPVGLWWMGSTGIQYPWAYVPALYTFFGFPTGTQPQFRNVRVWTVAEEVLP